MQETPQIPFTTAAWLMIGWTGAELGTLSFDGRRLTFSADNRELNFDIALSDLRDLTYPWYYFGGGFKATLPGRKIRMSLTAPNGRIDPDELNEERLGATGGGTIAAAAAMSSIGRGRKRMAQWRSVFQQKT